MKAESNFRKTVLDNSPDNQSKINFICVVEEDLDYEHLQSADEHCNSQVNECTGQSEKVKRFNYLCYLRSMDDMV